MATNRRILNLPLILSGKVTNSIVLPLDDPSDNLTKKINLGQIKDFVLSGVSLSGNYLSLSGGTVTGSTSFTNGLTANTISVNGINITGDTYVSGGTYNTGGTLTLSYNIGGGFQITGLTEDLNNEISTLAEADEQTITLNLITNKIELKESVASPSGGTRTFQGNIIVNSGLTANTISATTYQNLPQDIFVTGGTYTNGEILFRNNSGSYFTVTGLPIGGAGGEVYYLNLSQTQTPYKEFSPIGTNLTEQTTGVTINSGVTSTIASFLTPSGYPNTTTIPAGYWSFYIHSYKDVVNASFGVFCEVYTYTTGGTETLILTTEGADVTTNSPTVSMQLTDGYYSGGTIDVTDRILVKVRTTNNGSQTNTLSFFTEGQQHYSYGITPFSNFNALTCETLSGCTTIVNLENNKVNKGGDTMTGTLNVPTISATTYQNLPIDPDTYVTGFTYSNNIFTVKQNNGQPDLKSTINSVTGLTVNGNLTVTGNTTFTGGFSATTISTNTLILSGVSVNPKQTIALFFGHDSLSPSDTQTYYIGNSINLTAPITGSDGRRVIIPKTGNIVSVSIAQTVGGTLGSSETSTITVNNVTQSTQSTITTTYTYDASNANISYDLASPLAVTQGDKVELRWTTPTWVTNPTTVRQQMNVYLEY